MKWPVNTPVNRTCFRFIYMLFFFFPQAISSQEADTNYLIQYFSAEQGLSQNEVTSVIQDNDGFMWFGTRGGLNRFDSYEFIRFSLKTENTETPANPSIEKIFKDSSGKMWIGTKSNGIAVFNPANNEIQHIPFERDSENNLLSGKRVISFCEGDENTMWIGTWGNGLTKINTSQNTSRFYLDSLIVTSIARDNENDTWIGTNNGLYKYNKILDRIDKQTLPHNPNAIIKLFANNTKTKLWLMCGDTGEIISYETKSGETRKYPLVIQENGKSVTLTNMYSFLEDNKGIIWIGTWGNGLYRLDSNNGMLKKVQLHPNPQLSYNKEFETILDIFQDNNNNIWIGTNGIGICLLSENLGFETLGINNNPLMNSCIMSVFEDSEQTLWVGTRGNGLLKSTDKILFNKVPVLSPGFQNSFELIRAIYEDNKSINWVGTNYWTGIADNKGLINAATFFNNPALDTIQKALTFLEVDSLLFIGTQQRGLFALKNTGADCTIEKNFFPGKNGSGELSSERISHLIKDKKNRIWVATYDGLYVLNQSFNMLTSVKNLLSPEESFHSKIIYCLKEDTKGNIWAGTLDGLYKFTEDSTSGFKLKVYSGEEGLAGNLIMGILEDENQQLWISTNLGLSKFDPETGSFSNYYKYHGLQGNSFSETAAFRNIKNEMYFGGTFGLTRFNPQKIPETLNPVELVFTGISWLKQPVKKNHADENNIQQKNLINQIDEIKLKYGQKNFNIAFSALDYRAQGKNLYQYKLENYDEEWNFLGFRRFVNFNNLNPGEYTLKIRAANSNNVWNPASKDLKIIINPPFWQTWYAMVFYILIVIGIVTIIRWNAVKQVRLASNLEMEKLMHEQDVKMNEIKFSFFTNISHEFRTPLTLIMAPLNELIEKTKYEAEFSPLLQNKLLLIKSNAAKLLKLINQLIDFRKIETANLSIHAELVNIEEFVEEISHAFTELAVTRKIEFNRVSVLKNKLIWVDKEKTDVILNNLLSNAFKAVADNTGKIKILLNEDEKDVFITVQDNGTGIPESEINYIFDRFYQIEKNELQGGSGLGLSLAKSMAELQKGKITVESKPNKQTVFTFSLKKGDSHFSEKEKIQGAPPANELLNQTAPVIIKPDKPIEKKASNDSILIVEDNPEMRSYLEALLSAEFITHTAEDGLDGYQKTVQLKPNLILADVMMPKMDGFELCQKIRTNSETSAIPIILLTAKAATQYRLLGVKTGADDYISKPFDPVYLVEKINKLIKTRKELMKKFSKSIRLEPSEINISPYEKVLLEKAIKIIEHNLQNPKFTSEVLAKELFMSNSSLYRRLKMTTGFSTAEFIRSIRVKRAAQLLADKQRTISEISFEVGFAEIKNFRRAFQKHFQTTPADYRKSL